ncbi:MAG TPA: glutathione S-transferase family protein [Sphingobium sp.]|nr:glutathione S-transferase family protein [Sphingobium sp.]
MIELFHGGPDGYSAAVLITLAEKGLAFESQELDLAAFAQHEPGFLAINASGQVPVLRDGGRTLTESFFILLYLDARYPELPLGGADPQGRYVVQKWGKYVETHIAPNLALVDWAMRGRAPGEAERVRLATLAPERQALWAQALAGFAADEVEAARAALAKAADRIAEELAGQDWLAGADWSLVDAIVFPHAARFASLGIAVPAVLADWLARAGRRPAVRQALGSAGSVPGVATMGPERGRWG